MKHILSSILWALPSIAAAQTLGGAKIDSTLLEARMFKVIGDRSPALAELPSSFPVIIFSQNKTDVPVIGFPVNCKGRDPRAVINAFGEGFLDIDNPETVTEADLNEQFHIADQPILRCDALNGQNQISPQFSQVFRVIDRAGKQSYPLVRFNAFSPLDKRLFEAGCSDIFNTFWKEAADRPIIPIFKENLKDLPGSDDLGALHCYNTATANPTNLTYGSYTEPEPVFDARVYRVDDPEKGLVRVVITGGKTFRLNCSSADGELQTAFGLPNTGKLTTITNADPAFTDYLNGQMDAQPVLNCPSLSRPSFASDAYHVLNYAGLDARTASKNPLLRLASAQDALIQFSCESSAQFFAKKLLDEVTADASKLQPLTAESIDYAVRNYLPGQLKSRRYQLGCAPGLLAANDIKQLIRDVYGREPQSGEVSWHMNQCSTAGDQCTQTWMQERIVDRARATPLATARIIVTAFAGGAGYPGALGRVPQPEELNYYQKKRVHYKELVALLKTTKFLDRTLFKTATKQATAYEYYWDTLDIWTTRQLDNPTRVYTADLLKAEWDAYLKATPAYLEDVIRRSFEDNYWSGVQTFQINAMKAKITAGTVRALYDDMVNLLKNTGQTCVTVAANKEDQSFTFFKPHWKIASITGTWTADKAYYPLVAPTGHTGTVAAQALRLEQSQPLGRLLIGTKDSTGKLVPWVGWDGSKAWDHYLNEVVLLMNDYRTAFGDNSGSIKVCFE